MEIGIDFVVTQDLPGIKRQKAAGGYNIDCPFCKGKKKLHIDVDTNLARCAKCGNGKEVDKGFNAVTLHAKLMDLSTSEASKDLQKRMKGLSSDAKLKYQYKSSEPKEEIMPLLLRDEFYKAFLNKLSLTNKHKSDLLRRGLTEEEIIKNGYKSILANTDSKLFTKSVLKSLDKGFIKYLYDDFNKQHIKYAVPGFSGLYTKEPDMYVPKYDGYLIPVKSISGHISGFQIRHDNNIDAKYTWFSSSGMKDGASVRGVGIHHAGFDKYKENFPKALLLTEGCLKADVASYLLDKPFIAVMGVSNLSKLKDDLVKEKKLGVETILIAIDMDYREKKEVNNALRKIISIIKEAGLKTVLVNWDKRFKGIDDFALAKQKDNTLKFEIKEI